MPTRAATETSSSATLRCSPFRSCCTTADELWSRLRPRSDGSRATAFSRRARCRVEDERAYGRPGLAFRAAAGFGSARDRPLWLRRERPVGSARFWRSGDRGRGDGGEGPSGKSRRSKSARSPLSATAGRSAKAACAPSSSSPPACSSWRWSRTFPAERSILARLRPSNSAPGRAPACGYFQAACSRPRPESANPPWPDPRKPRIPGPRRIRAMR